MPRILADFIILVIFIFPSFQIQYRYNMYLSAVNKESSVRFPIYWARFMTMFFSFLYWIQDVTAANDSV